MGVQPNSLRERIASGKTVLLAEIRPPKAADPGPLLAAAGSFAGKVHAVGVSDNRDGVAMSALAAASLLKAKGLETVLHVTTRDRNRIALVSEALGAQAMGILNFLCTSGTHQTLGPFRAARNVYDIDTVQLLQTYHRLSSDGGPVGENGFPGAGPFCLGAVASPDADPFALQMMRLVKKIKAGARFVVTQPVYDLERFGTWWEEATLRGLHEQAAVLAGIAPLSEGNVAQEKARSQSRIPDSLIGRLASESDPAARRAAAIAIAVETVRRLSDIPGIRGFCICADGDHEAALRIIEDAGLRSD
jgi:methylenetetrahydrofolate reductase (NADPH)